MMQAELDEKVSSAYISLNFPCGLGVSLCQPMLCCPHIHKNGDSSMSQSHPEGKGFQIL